MEFKNKKLYPVAVGMPIQQYHFQPILISCPCPFKIVKIVVQCTLGIHSLHEQTVAESLYSLWNWSEDISGSWAATTKSILYTVYEPEYFYELSSLSHRQGVGGSRSTRSTGPWKETLRGGIHHCVHELVRKLAREMPHIESWKSSNVTLLFC